MKRSAVLILALMVVAILVVGYLTMSSGAPAYTPPGYTPPVTGSPPASSFAPAWNTNEAGALYTGVVDGTYDVNVCNGVYNGNLTPGKSWRGYGKCNLGVGGKEVIVPIGGYLQAAPEVYRWSKTVPTKRVKGGADPAVGDLYVCRGKYNGGWHPGRTWNGNAACNIGWGGAEYPVADMEHLTY